MTHLEMSEELDRLREENAELREQADRIGQQWDRLASCHHQMHEWLFRFGRHTDECLNAPVASPCVCGLAAALNPNYPTQTATKAA